MGLPLRASSAWTSMPRSVSYVGGTRSKRRLTLLQENALQQRILVPKHQTLISSSTVALLESLERILMMLDGRFELLDVFCSSLTECCLRLAISLLALLRSGIYLDCGQPYMDTDNFKSRTYRLPSSFAFWCWGRILTWLLRVRLYTVITLR